ncbi:MAG: glucosamine-6-phosphate deaminase [Candidatus Gribaldobacteria bacterium]|nr:glucosamine-6-phosphate deaminase [Candidatus Gribaldobacteria bacterium]
MLDKKSLEKIPVRIFPNDSQALSLEIARLVAQKIQQNNTNNKNTVLGLATGHTPLDVYRELVRIHQEEGLSFQRVITFNLDEYCGLPADEHRSYHRFMFENLFNYLDIPKENIHIPDGLTPQDQIEQACSNYEQAIKQAGGIDIQILGIGRDGHIGFNEPGYPMDSRTRLITLDEITRKDALSDFAELKYVPHFALTMGIATILEAKEIILIARGDHKAKIIQETVEGEITNKVAASHLQEHSHATIFADEASASELTRIKTPWLVAGEANWNNPLAVKKAICYLAQRLATPILKITEQDLIDNQMSELATQHSLAELLANIHQSLLVKIKNEQDLPQRKKIVVFAPHPDDDVISLGATLKKLVANQNEIITIYMTPGYTAVFDYAVENFLLQLEKVHLAFDFEDKFKSIRESIHQFLQTKKGLPFGSLDSPEVLKVKTVIRMVEAISACEFLGVKQYEFLEMPFYRTGGAKKMPVTPNDIQIVLGILSKYQPDIIFAADDLNDPHGTHRLCLSAIKQALTQYPNKVQTWYYRGAWQEYHPLEANVFIPFTKEEAETKRQSIFRHQSQKDTPPLPVSSDLEFSQRAEMRNKATAALLNLYGLGNYEAIEAFKIID